MCNDAKIGAAPPQQDRNAEQAVSLPKDAGRFYEIHILEVIGSQMGSRQVEEVYGPYTADELISVQHSLSRRTYKIVKRHGRVLHL